jgi:hypothetical protein
MQIIAIGCELAILVSAYWTLQSNSTQGYDIVFTLLYYIDVAMMIVPGLHSVVLVRTTSADCA